MTMPPTIREYIKGDLRGRIGSGAALPVDLTLAALSGHYGVSFTPVREAIRDLVSEGILRKGVGGRVEVNPARRKRAVSEPVAPPRSSARIESELAVEMIGKSLRGEADYVREEATAARFGVGRTAIRQVFSRLSGRGLLVHVPRCGWRVRAFDGRDLDAYLEAREAVELKALDLAWPRLEDAELRRMLAGNDPRGPRLNNEIHLYLIETSRNPYLRDFFDRHGAYYTTLFDFAAPETSEAAEMARQHRAILEALIVRDRPATRRELSRHIRAQSPVVQDLLARLGRTPRPEKAPR